MQLEVQGEPDALIFNLDNNERANRIQGLVLGAEAGGRPKVLFKIIQTYFFKPLEFLTGLMDSY